jgi:hypothetical protein
MFSKSRGRSEVNPVRVPKVEAQSNSSSSPARSSGAANTILDVLYMGGTGISYSFQWHWFQAQIHSESTGIVERS